MNPTFEIHEGDCIDLLRQMPTESVQMVCTSPPYWGLRNYEIEPSVWGGDPNCLHSEWGDEGSRRNGRDWDPTAGHSAVTRDTHGSTGQFCSACHAWRGALGLEPTPDLYLQHMVEVFRQVRRVLHSSGSVWLNLGDSYATGAGAVGEHPGGGKQGESWRGFRGDHTVGPKRNPRGIPKGPMTQPNRMPIPGLKPKDLCMLPARLALALQADGWYLRQQIPWLKHNCMPESCTDRPTSACEYIYLLSKSETYYYDREAVRIAASGNRGGGRQRAATMGDGRYFHMHNPKDADGRTGRHSEFQPSTRARRNSDWFFSSLESYSHDFQGMLTDEDADPLAMIVNPQPFSLEMCGGCETIYAQREYRQLRMLCKCGATFHPVKETKACPTCGGKEYRRQCLCGSAEWVSHFATFPERLVAPMILAGTSEYGCCHHCGAPYERILEKQHHGDWHPDANRGHDQAQPARTGKMGKHDRGAVNRTAKWAKEAPQASGNRMNGNVTAARRAFTANGDPINSIALTPGQHNQPFHAPITLGWRPTCDHPMFPAEPVPCVTLDPFSGSGRTGLAAYELGRSYIGLERNPRYVKMSTWQFEQRFVRATPLPAQEQAGNEAKRI